MNPLIPYLTVAVLLFAIGMAGALTRRNAIIVLVGIELMLNAGNLSFVAFWRFAPNPNPNPDPHTGLMVALFSIAIAAAEAAVGLALILAIFRHRRTTALDGLDTLKG